ncbi:hypothetical protein BDW74DRAFT_149984 [Aspergillus multicolor]|uniref:uncharacterized protein n=1 Tax=Aspergillus multicolor TaxID=41759 RepID=UPI003CCDEAA4
MLDIVPLHTCQSIFSGLLRLRELLGRCTIPTWRICGLILGNVTGACVRFLLRQSSPCTQYS